MLTVSDFIKKTGLVFGFDRIEKRPGSDRTESEWGRYASHWLVWFTVGGRELRTFYSMGEALKGNPDPADVLDSLRSEYVFPDCEFEEWASDFGMDTDSRKLEKLFKACQDDSRKLEILLGDHLDEFLADVEPL